MVTGRASERDGDKPQPCLLQYPVKSALEPGQCDTGNPVARPRPSRQGWGRRNLGAWWLLQAVAVGLIWGSLFLHHVLNGLWSQGALLFPPQTDRYGFRCLGRGLGGCLLN